MPKKEKIVPCIITSRESMESVVADIVGLKLEHAELTAAMEQEIAQVQKRHQGGILAVDRQIQVKEAGVFVYCQQNRKVLFPEKKSIDLLLATVGFRDNPPSVEKRMKKDTWEAVADRLQALDWGQAYLTERAPDVSKAKLLADRERLTEDQLAAAGVRFEQDETFFIAPKSQVAEPTVKEAA